MTTFGLFSDSKKAGEAVALLHQEGFTKDISLIAKDDATGDVSHEQVEHDVTDGVTAGAIAGGIFGLVAGVLALTPIAVTGLLIAGPLATALSAATGAVTGGIVGGLVDVGIPEERARIFEERIKRGEVLVAVSSAEDKTDRAHAVLTQYGATDVMTAEV